MRDRQKKIVAFLGPYASSKLTISLGISLIIAMVALNINLFRVEAFFYDTRSQLKFTESLHPEIVLLAIGEKDKDDVADPNWSSIEDQAIALEQILKAKPRTIVYLNKFDPSDIESKPRSATKFMQLARDAMASGTNIFFGTDVDLGGEVLPPYPISLLPHAPSLLHKDGTIFGEDKVMRRSLLNVFNEPSIHVRAAFPNATKEALIEKIKTLRGAYYFEPADSWHVLTNYPSSTVYTENTFPRVYFSDVLQGKNLDRLAGKTILIDSIRKDLISDFGYTPFARVTYTNPRLMVHAAVLDTIMKNRGIIMIPDTLDIALTFLLALVLAYVAITKSPTRGVLSLAALALGLFVVSLGLFQLGLWLRLVHPLVAMFLTYYLIVPYRAILEYKKRWEVQEKHDLLVQVEEMKGNFLSLMSHDLKTPVARIQGLAELVLRQGELKPEQRGEIQQIISSTENLDKFISKILALTKVESNEIKLQKKSKDINKILEQCVQKLEFQARAKNIEVSLELDPLFPIQVDAALIIQVFTNIVDNAIKYSPTGSKICISSKEIGEFVEVIIEDSGPGMDEDEKSQLFTKFFRGKSHMEEQIKGSGLGLYLSKYFIELHNGDVDVSSQKGVGSKFVIHLPIQGDLS